MLLNVVLKNEYDLPCGEELVEVNDYEDSPLNNQYFKNWLQEEDLKVKDYEIICPFFCKGHGGCYDKNGVYKCFNNCYIDIEDNSIKTIDGLEINYWALK